MAILDTGFLKSRQLISYRTGLLGHIIKQPRLNGDPKLISFGIWPCDTTRLGGEKYGGRSSGCSFDLYASFMGTLGETVERYCPVFYDIRKMIKSTYAGLSPKAISPAVFALFHEKQYQFFQERNYKMYRFNEQTELYWDQCVDITNGESVYCPSAFIYLPWTIEDRWITVGTSTGLAAHTHWHKALLTALYEIVERDSFVLTWYQKIVSPKIVIDQAIETYIKNHFPTTYEWHFFDITYDLGIPTVFGICYGEAEYGKFVAVGTATRGTYGDALRKVILEIGQSVGYFRYLLGQRKEWNPTDDFNQLLNFEDHSVFYLKRPDLLPVLDRWRNAVPMVKIDFSDKEERTILEQIRHVVGGLKEKKYNVLVKDLTTPDANQAGFYSLRVIVPQLLQMGGSYPFYFLGGRRLYEVPASLGYETHSFDELNKYPHPFP